MDSKTEDQGRDIVNSTLLGKQYHPSDICEKSALKGLIRESRVLRWLAVTVRSEFFSKLLNSGHAWPENGTFFHLWTPVEDYILEITADRFLQEIPKHMSLHFDAIRISYKSSPPVGIGKDDLANHVLQKCG